MQATTNQQDKPRKIGLNPFAINFFKLVFKPIAAMATIIPNLPALLKKWVTVKGKTFKVVMIEAERKPMINQGNIFTRL